MKHLTMIIILFGLSPFLKAEELSKPYPIQLDLKTNSEEIRYGDFLITSIHLTNEGPLKITACIDPRFYWGYASRNYSLHFKENDKELLRWEKEDEFYDKESTTAILTTRSEYRFPRMAMVPPGGTVEVCYRPIWIPPPDIKGDHFREKYATEFQQEQKVVLRVLLNFTGDYYGPNWSVEKNEPLPRQEVQVWRRETSDVVPLIYTREHGYASPKYTVEKTLKILPREQEEYDLIRAWYQEIPGPYQWNDGTLFQFNDYDRNSPFRHFAGTGRENGRAFWLSHEKELLNFLSKSQNRNDFTLTRIRRSKELESQIVERSKQPDATISQNMAEFVQLRGFLVEMRYAENEVSENEAFEKMCNFVEKSHDKILWTHLLTEIGFDSIADHEYFPASKTQYFIKLFRERFDEID